MISVHLAGYSLLPYFELDDFKVNYSILGEGKLQKLVSAISRFHLAKATIQKSSELFCLADFWYGPAKAPQPAAGEGIPGC